MNGATPPILFVAFLFIALTASVPANADPSISVVMDRQGNVYYSDLKAVWKIGRDGSKRIAVPSVHTHELWMDADDNLYGEHLWYEGDQTRLWGHRIWRLAADGQLVDVIKSRRGFRDDYDDFHFVRDAQKNMYWAQRGDLTQIRTRSLDGQVKTIASIENADLRRMTATPVGVLYAVNGDDLVRIEPNGSVRTVAADLVKWSWKDLIGGDNQSTMGIWTGAEGSVYVAVPADRLVKRIQTDGSVSVVARSTSPWSPTGGLTDKNGDIWLLEYTGSTVTTRVRRIGAAGSETVFDQ